jgi:hypothetical protein
MTAIETLSRRIHIADRAIALAIGSMMLLPITALREVSAADTTLVSSRNQEADESIRPFEIHVPQSQLDDLRKRIADTRWPDKEASMIGARQSRS